MRKFVRVWEELDLKEVEKHLIVVGQLSAECFSCHSLGLDVSSRVCPRCGAKFKYMAFRRAVQISYLAKMKEEFSEVIFIDFEDFKRAYGKLEAKRILDI